LRSRGPALLAYLEELAVTPLDPAQPFQEKAGTPYEGAPCIYVDEARSARRRIEVLSALPASALKIFGGADWARAGGAVARAYAGRAVPYGYDLSSLYYHSKINVNVFHEQCVDSTNSRVYDVLAAGGFLLTEYRPCLEREFEIGRHIAAFETAAEARGKVEYYLAHADEREAMAREGQTHVLGEHTFGRQCQSLLSVAIVLLSWRN
jgi:spore maturation protein CgeB